MTTPTLEHARALDAADPLRHWRDEFWIPDGPIDGRQIYFCGNSLGLQPKRARAVVEEELDRWRRLGVGGHFQGQWPWKCIHEAVREPLAAVVGGKPLEVVAMNSLTTNLHLLMVSFYRPQGRRRKIVIERQPFPSDRYAVESQIRWHGLDPEDCLVEVGDAWDEAGSTQRLVGEERLEAYLEEYGDEVALVLWPGIQYASGQNFDLARITRAAHEAGAMVGFDLAHAVGNVALSLHEDGADFAAWCSYKYLNSGPGSVAGAFVHERHHHEQLPRLQGWWGVDLPSRFLMAPEFIPAPGVDAWQLSNQPVLSLAPLRASLEIFGEVGMPALRRKSEALTGYLEQLVNERLAEHVEIITPSEPARRGCQLSLRIRQGRARGRALFEHLEAGGIIGDWREPDVIRISPVPLYNRFEDCWQVVERMRQWLAGAAPSC